MSTSSRRALGWLASLLVLPAVAFAEASEPAWWQRLVMPGELAAPHAELSSDCAQCHKSFDRGEEASLCLTCHEDVAGDIHRKEGFHGRAGGALGAECRSCHPDHKGADFDIVGLEPALFDHDLTDFPLVGAHLRSECEACHASETRYREAESACFACHAEDDAHAGALGEDCGSCHESSLTSPSSWHSAGFDHDETRFPLTGAHEDVACGLCHASTDYRAAPQDCFSCHRTDDAHAGELGRDCASCHDTGAWKRSGFDHHAVSGFALRGQHAQAACNSCHVQPPGQKELPEDCGSCHRLDDTHRGAYGADCGRCHEATGWSAVRFDHAKEANFALKGVHDDLSCESCHRVSLTEPKLGTACMDCHIGDDAHSGQLGRACGDCHGERGFGLDVFFDHELTGFPLLGLHALVSCEHCHATARFQDAQTSCGSCHAADDPHEGALGDDCSRCHNPNGWRVWRFDHQADTDFALHGSHEGLACGSCHVPGRSGPSISADCDSCHSREDPHRGSFGRDCGMCHDAAAWLPARIGGRR